MNRRAAIYPNALLNLHNLDRIYFNTLLKPYTCCMFSEHPKLISGTTTIKNICKLLVGTLSCFFACVTQVFSFYFVYRLAGRLAPALPSGSGFNQNMSDNAAGPIGYSVPELIEEGGSITPEQAAQVLQLTGVKPEVRGPRKKESKAVPKHARKLMLSGLSAGWVWVGFGSGASKSGWSSVNSCANINLVI